MEGPYSLTVTKTKECSTVTDGNQREALTQRNSAAGRRPGREVVRTVGSTGNTSRPEGRTVCCVPADSLLHRGVGVGGDTANVVKCSNLGNPG